MPGLEPQDITINLSGDGNLTLTGELRGTLKGENEIIMDEWNPGAYSRSLSISEAVDAGSADASYQNGVLVVSFPMSDSYRSGQVTLERISPTEGKRDG
jgi:HSP20 family molecular chaperone IbpA